MPVDIKSEVTAESLADLSATLRLLSEATGRTASESVTYAGIKIAESARSASKLGKTNRDIIANPAWAEGRAVRARINRQKARGQAVSAQDAMAAAQAGSPLLIVAMNQKGPPQMWPAWERKDTRRKIENRGLAKGAWNRIVGKLASMADGGGSGDRDIYVSKRILKLGDSAGEIAARLINKLPYAEKAYPGLVQTAVTNGTKALKGAIEKGVAKAVREANRGKR